MACQFSNGAIIGSAFIKVLETDNYLQTAKDFIKKIRN
jgi:tryptophan synthase alpha subunit